MIHINVLIIVCFLTIPLFSNSKHIPIKREITFTLEKKPSITEHEIVKSVSDLYPSTQIMDTIKKYELNGDLSYLDGTYPDVASGINICFGHQITEIDTFTNRPYTISECDSILYQDLLNIKNCLLNLVDIQLTQEQFDALLSFCYQNGVGNFEYSTLRKKINSNSEVSEIEFEFMRWVYYRDSTGTELKVSEWSRMRRNIESKLWKTKLKDSEFTTNS